MTMGFTVIYYVWAINAPAYAQTTLKIDPTSALWAGVVGNLVFLVCLPLWGRLSDRVGRKPVLLSALVGAAVLYIPMNALLKDAAWQLVVSMSVMLAVIAAVASIGPAVYAEMFPTHVRAAGFGFPYSIAIALFGGTAPLIQAWMAEHFQSTGRVPVLRHRPHGGLRADHPQPPRDQGDRPARGGPAGRAGGALTRLPAPVDRPERAANRTSVRFCALRPVDPVRSIRRTRGHGHGPGADEGGLATVATAVRVR